jgi:hypothetical protein
MGKARARVLPAWLSFETIFNIIVGITGLVAFAVELFNADDPWKSLTSLGSFFLLLVAFLAYAYFLSRKERYADITAHIEDVSDRCRKARKRLRTSEDVLEPDSKFRDDLEASLEVILTDIATIFSMVSGVRCRVALKTFRPLANGEFYCVTLARDHISAPSFHNGDRSRAAAKFDTLDKNPHLLSLFSDKIDGEDWEVFNDIPKMIAEGRYASSSLLWEMKISHTTRGAHEPHKLPYRSAVTALIRNKEGVAVAFIGVDSSARNAFRQRSDGALLAALGGYIGPLLEEALAALDAADERRRAAGGAPKQSQPAH